MINEGIVNVSYIIATILFILALGGLSNQETARRGNWYGIIGMTIALLATIFGGDVTANYEKLIVALLIGGSVGLIVLIGAVIIGGFLLALALGLAMILGLVVFVRVWWLKRKYRAAAGSAAQKRAADSSVIEVEYTVVEERDDDDRGGRQ